MALIDYTPERDARGRFAPGSSGNRLGRPRGDLGHAVALWSYLAWEARREKNPAQAAVDRARAERARIKVIAHLEDQRDDLIARMAARQRRSRVMKLELQSVEQRLSEILWEHIA